VDWTLVDATLVDRTLVDATLSSFGMITLIIHIKSVTASVYIAISPKGLSSAFMSVKTRYNMAEIIDKIKNITEMQQGIWAGLHCGIFFTNI